MTSALWTWCSDDIEMELDDDPNLLEQLAQPEAYEASDATGANITHMWYPPIWSDDDE